MTASTGRWQDSGIPGPSRLPQSRIGSAIGEKLAEHFIRGDYRSWAEIRREIHYSPMGLVFGIGQCDPIESVGKEGAQAFLFGEPYR